MTAGQVFLSSHYFQLFLSQMGSIIPQVCSGPALLNPDGGVIQMYFDHRTEPSQQTPLSTVEKQRTLHLETAHG